MAHVTQEMVFMRMEDIGAYAEARVLVRLANEILAATPGGKHDRDFVALRDNANAVAAILLDGLRATEPVIEVRRLREVSIALTALRDLVWDLYSSDLLSSHHFDEVMKTTARCRRESVKLESAARHRGRRRLEAF